VTGTPFGLGPDPSAPLGRTPRAAGLTDLDAALSAVAVRNLVSAVAPLVDTGAAVAVLGAGLGLAASVLSAHGARVLAVDPADAVLATVTPHPDVTIRSGSAASLPADDATLDAVVVIDAIAGLDRDGIDTVLAEVRRVLHGGGVAIVASPADYPGSELAGRLLGARFGSVVSLLQVDVGGSAILSADDARGPFDDVSLGASASPERAALGIARLVHIAADRPIAAPAPLVHLTPGVATGLMAGMHELLEHQAASARRIAELEAEVAHLHDVGRRLVDAEQTAASARELEAALADARARITELHGMIDTILRSTSWKVTEPVRKASGVAKNVGSRIALDTLRDTVRRYREG
jgi:SAM-dependent methyltransferase